MKKIIIDKSEDGIKFIKYLKNIFKEMPDSLIYKLIRKKYFKINGKIANTKDVLKTDDSIEVYLSEDTFNKFYNYKTKSLENSVKKNKINIDEIKKNIVYEDNNLIIFNKWQGILSQDNGSGDISLNKLLNEYLQFKNHTNIKENELNNKTKDNTESTIKNSYNFIPSVVNRLDRNTEGLIIFAKTYLFSREISKMISENRIEKYYITIVNGKVQNKTGELVNLYKKDEKNNIAIIKDIDDNVNNDFSVVKLKYRVIDNNDDFSLLDIKLITGKSHQIRAQLSYINHPIICDKKYMNKELYEKNIQTFTFKNQKLMCYSILFSKFENNDLKYLSNKKFEIYNNYRGIYDEI